MLTSLSVVANGKDKDGLHFEKFSLNFQSSQTWMKSEGVLIKAAMQLIACSPGLLKKMRLSAQSSKL